MHSEPLVQITDGALRGQAPANGGFCFAGITFAAPPIGPLRFQPLQPVEPWTGVRDAWAFPPAPIQRPLQFPADIWSDFASTYVVPNIEDNWAALFRSTTLFRRVAMEVGSALGTLIPRHWTTG